MEATAVETKDEVGVVPKQREKKIWLNGDYQFIFDKRRRVLEEIDGNSKRQEWYIYLYASNPIEFINTWVMTENPRENANLPIELPLVLFKRQRELVTWLVYLLRHQKRGIVEKSRDMGATWVCCAFSVWMWLFRPSSKVLWMTKKSAMLDSKNDSNCIFEKIRFIIRNLPEFLIPIDFHYDDHMTGKRIANVFNNSQITGCIGEDGGRSGRASIVFKDESAHYENQVKIERGCCDVSPVTIDISSVNGVGNLFYDMAMSAIEYDIENEDQSKMRSKFIMDWRDHPEKDQAWYDERRAQDEAKGDLAGFAQEVDRDYCASNEGILIKPEWLKACIDADEKILEISGGKIDMTASNRWYGGVDISDEGKDKSALVARRGNVIYQVEEWGNIDYEDCANRVISYVNNKIGIEIRYDANGVGTGIKALWQRMLEKDISLSDRMEFIKYWSQGKVNNPHLYLNGDESGIKNKDFFENQKAQGWWQVYYMVYNTYNSIKTGKIEDPDNLISFPSTLKNLRNLMSEISQIRRTTSLKGKFMIDKKLKGEKSPNMADALMMCLQEEGFVTVEVMDSNFVFDHS